MTLRLMLFCVIASLLAACAQDDVAPTGAAVASKADAIAIAQSACQAALGKVEEDGWKAQLVNGVWWVSLGYEVEIRIDAMSGQPSDCEQTIVVG